MELTDKQLERFSQMIHSFLEEHGIIWLSEWDDDFSKEHDFYELVKEVEKYMEVVEEYGINEIAERV